MLINLCAKLAFFLLISSIKFHARTIAQSGFVFIFSFDMIGIFIPGKNLPCFSWLSSTIYFISLDIPKKFKAVVALAGEPYPIIYFSLDASCEIFFLTLSLIL